MSNERLNRHQRRIVERIIVRGTLALDTPTCLGNGDAEGVTDLMLLRDSISSKALLTGASIAGALRNHLYEYQYGYQNSNENKEDEPESSNHLTNLSTYLFGAERKDESGDQSPLIIYDSISNEVPRVELRDGVRIKSETGTADDGAKYDLELLAAGTEFPLCFELLIEENKDKNLLLKALILALQGLENHEISLGMKKRRGFGRCKVKAWQVWKFDLTQDDKRLEWLLFEHWRTELSPEHETYSSIATALGVSLDEEEDKRDRFSIKATFKLTSSLLIRSGQDSTGCAPDVVHLKSYRDGELKPIISGTSLAGVLRHRAERIVNTLNKPEKIVNDLFGFVEKENKQAKASRLIVHESVIENTADAELVQTRIAIDRFTGGTYHGALFQEQPVFGNDNTEIKNLEIELRNPKEYEIGLLLLLLKYLWTEDLPVGGGNSIGRGRLKGQKAKIKWKNLEWKIKQNDDNSLSITPETAKETLQNYVSELVTYIEENQNEQSNS